MRNFGFFTVHTGEANPSSDVRLWRSCRGKRNGTQLSTSRTHPLERPCSQLDLRSPKYQFEWGFLPSREHLWLLHTHTRTKLFLFLQVHSVWLSFCRAVRTTFCTLRTMLVVMRFLTVHFSCFRFDDCKLCAWVFCGRYPTTRIFHWMGPMDFWRADTQ